MNSLNGIEQIDYNHVFNNEGRAFDMTVAVFDNAPLVGNQQTHANDDPIFFFHGFGSGEHVAKYLLNIMAKEGLRVIAPQINLSKTPKEIAPTTHTALERVGRELVPELIATHTPKGTEKAKATSNSMGSTILGYCLKDASELLGDISCVNPMGLSNFIEPITDSTLKFYKRFVTSSMQQNPFQAGILKASRGITMQIITGLVNRTLPTMLKIANEESFNEEFANHALQHEVKIYSGSKDTLFLTQEIRKSFAAASQELNIANRATVHEVTGLAHENEALKRCSSLLISLVHEL